MPQRLIWTILIILTFVFLAIIITGAMLMPVFGQVQMTASVPQSDFYKCLDNCELQCYEKYK